MKMEVEVMVVVRCGDGGDGGGEVMVGVDDDGG